MAAMSEMNLVIEELRTAANALISAADSLAQMYSTPEETEAELLQERKPLSLDEVRDILRRKCEEGFAADVKDMIASLGAKSLKLLGKKHFAELLAGLVERPQGKPVLVTEDDKRPEMNTAQNDFND